MPIPGKETLALFCAAFLALSAVTGMSAATEEKTFTAVSDTYIRSDSDAVQSNGTSGQITVGSLANGADMRGLFSFDLSSLNLASNQSISSVTLVLTSIGKDGVGDSVEDNITVELYALETTFVESQATWSKATTDTSWGTPGGDLGTAFGGTSVKTGIGTAVADGGERGKQYTWKISEKAAVDYITSCVGSSLNLILKRDVITNIRTIANFASKDHGTTNYRPQLVIEIMTAPIPEPATFVFVSGILVLGATCVWRGNRFRKS
ncbi:MAG: DNRLRE domain-containing protein [Opitutaceae bacterium]|nr:DNRLRE domain-containing protein [Opitutaceae bacterium]